MLHTWIKKTKEQISLTALLLIAASIGILYYLLTANAEADQLEDQMRAAYEIESLQEQTSSAADAPEGEQVHRQAPVQPAHPQPHLQVGAPSTWKGIADRPDVFARMRIPKMDLIAPIVHGVEDKQIKSAIGHFVQESVMPGEIGNSAYAAHNNHLFGSFFNRIHELEMNDEIIIDDLELSYTYLVTDIFVVKPEEVWVLEPFLDGKRTITLVTCESPENGGNKFRVIVRGVLMTSDEGDSGQVRTLQAQLREAGELPYQPMLLAGGLQSPVDAAQAKDGSLLVAERSGSVKQIKDDKLESTPVYQAGSSSEIVAMALDPNHKVNGFVYLYERQLAFYPARGRLVRLTYQDGKLTSSHLLMKELPGSWDHAALAIDESGMLYAALSAGSEDARLLSISNVDADRTKHESSIRELSSGEISGLAFLAHSSQLFAARQHTDGTEDLYPLDTEGMPSEKGSPVEAMPVLHSGTDEWDAGRIVFASSGEWDGALLIPSRSKSGILKLTLHPERRNIAQRLEFYSLGDFGPLGGLYEAEDSTLLGWTDNGGTKPDSLIAFTPLPITVNVAGKAAAWGSLVYLDNGVPMLPFKELMTSLELPYAWTSSTLTATIRNGAHAMEIQAGSAFIQYNGQKQSMERKAVLKGGRIYVPLDAFNKRLLLTASWDAENRKILVNGKK
jgi:LPXTG-site transpeptidase (sortase) family protein